MPAFDDWDDLVHGTVVFGAIVPFAVALGVGLKFPARLWLAVGLALAPSLLWFFGLPKPPLTSDDALVSALAVALALATFEECAPKWRGARHPARLLLWGLLAWFLYPAWLAAEGGSQRRLLVTGAIAVSVSGFGCLMEKLLSFPSASRLNLTPAAVLPLAIGLSVLLVTGGASQFAQSSGAIASTVAALCVVLLLGSHRGGLGCAAALWGMLLVFLAWSGWLFAEIRPGAAAILFLSPLVAAFARLLPLPRHRPFLAMLWDGAASILAVAPVIAIILSQYLAEGADEYDGY